MHIYKTNDQETFIVRLYVLFDINYNYIFTLKYSFMCVTNKDYL